jgi:hypothetical protein
MRGGTGKGPRVIGACGVPIQLGSALLRLPRSLQEGTAEPRVLWNLWEISWEVRGGGPGCCSWAWLPYPPDIALTPWMWAGKAREGGPG